jgi:hypothetical protein
MEWATQLLADFEERNEVGGVDGWTVLSQATFRGRVKFMGPNLARHDDGQSTFFIGFVDDGEKGVKWWSYYYKAEIASLVNFVELLSDPPDDFSSLLLPRHVELAARGKQLRAQLPSYLEQQRAAVVAHCPLPIVLQSIVAECAAPTPMDKWTDGLHIQDPVEKRARLAADVDQADEALPQLRRSLRLQQRQA